MRNESNKVGIKILGSIPDSPVAKAGVRFGDILISIAGTPVNSWQEYADYTEKQSICGKPIDIIRGNQFLTLQIPES